MLKVGVIGIGGVGGYFGGKLAACKEKDYHLSFIARGEHMKKIKERGLLLKTSNEGEMICHADLVTDDMKALPILDICIIAVKSYDLDQVLEQLKEKVDAHTKVIPLLNGIDMMARVRKVLPQVIIYPACVYVGTHIEASGVVTQNGGSCMIYLGKDPYHPSSEAGTVCTLFDKAGIKYNYQEDNRIAIWEKFMCISAYGLVTAYYNCSMGVVYSDPIKQKELRTIMEEIEALAKLEGIALDEDCVSRSIEKAKQFPYETKTSFQRDYEKGMGRDERDIFGGAIIRLAKKWKFEATMVQRFYQGLR